MSDEQSILERISAVRSGAEPIVEPTAPTEAVDVSSDETLAQDETEVEATEPVGEIDVEAEAKEPESELTAEVLEPDEDDDLYVTVGDREISIKDIKEMEQGQLRQSDYTRKTQALADERKEFDANKAETDQLRQMLSDQTAQLAAILEQETLSQEEIQELREYDAEGYIKYQEKMISRNQLLEKSKQVAPPEFDPRESEKLWSSNPSWGSVGSETDVFRSDMEMMQDYARSNDYSDEELMNINQSRHFQTMLKAARWEKSQKSNASIAKKVRKAPVTTKPKQAQVSSIQAQVDKAYAKFQNTNSVKDAVAYRQLKRKLTA
jgi:hypothetical protein